MAKYTEEQRISAIAVLAANGGNISKTARQTGVSRMTLREWQASGLDELPEVATIKKEFTSSYRDKLKRAREAGLDRMLELIPAEHDLHKVTGAVKVLSELNITEEVADDYSRSPKTLDENEKNTVPNVLN